MRGFVLRGTRRGRPDLPDAGLAPASTVWADPTLAFEEVAEPQLQGPFDVLVRVAACGVCGSDLHCSEAGNDGFVRFGGPARLPVTLGHEFTGEVVAVGSRVTTVGPGDFVTAESMWACWQCEECLAGHPNECRRVELLGLTVNGALAPMVRVDARHVYSIAPLVSAFGYGHAIDVGTLLEPFGVALRGLTRARLTAADRVVVVGAGPIGLAAITLAIDAGVSDVVAFDRIESRAALAESLGARAFVLNGRPPGVDAVHRVHGAGGASLVVEAAGTVDAFQLAFAALSNRGRLLVLGRMPELVPFDTNTLLSKALTVFGSRGHAGYGFFKTLINKMASGTLDPSCLITARFQFNDVARALCHARRADGGKTLIQMEKTK